MVTSSTKNFSRFLTLSSTGKTVICTDLYINTVYIPQYIPTIRESREIYFSSLDSDLARQPKRFWSFFKLKNRMRTFPETMSSGDDNQQSPQASTPRQIAELFNSYFVSVFTAPSEVRTQSAFHALTPHTKWARDPSGNGFDIYQTAWYKQSNWIPWNSSAPAEGNRWPDRTVPDHVIQQIFAARHFSRTLETHEYSAHFQERKKRPFGESSPYLPSPCHLQSSPALRPGGSTGSHIPPLQPRTAWLFSR